MNSKANQTIAASIVQTIKEKTYVKEWILLTYKQLKKAANAQEKRKKLTAEFFQKEHRKRKRTFHTIHP